MAEASILDSTKKVLGIEKDYTEFDEDIIMHINSVLSTLHQLGIGPIDGFQIEDSDPTWDAFLGADPTLNFVKTYVYLRVKMVFDPPATHFAIAAVDRQILELEWRINVARETVTWIPPVLQLDGGTAVVVE